MTDTVSQQMAFPFDMEQEKEQLGELFPEFGAAAQTIYQGAKRSVSGIVDVGRGLTDMVRLVGVQYAKGFVDRKTWMTWTTARKYMRIFDRFKDRDIEGTVPFTVLYLIAGIDSDEEFESALSLAMDGKTASEIDDWLKEKRKSYPSDSPRLVDNEADVKHALRSELEAEGAQVEEERRLANGGVIDLLSDFAVYECKYILSRKTMYSALGQTETYCWEVGRRKRVIAYAGTDEGLTVLMHQARQVGGVEFRQVQIVARARGAA